MISKMLENIESIYIAYGATDFRCQINSLCKIVENEFHVNPYSRSKCFIFCNKRRDSIKVLVYDRNRIYTSSEKIIGNREV